MLRFCLLTATLVISTNLFSQDPLPWHMTQVERLIWNEYLKNYPDNKGTVLSAQTTRTPGAGWKFEKWEANEATYQTQSKLKLYPNPSNGMVWIKNNR